MTPLEPNACHRNRSVRCDGPATHRHFAFESEVLGGVETYVLDIWACDEHFKWFGLKATDEPVTAFLTDEVQSLRNEVAVNPEYPTTYECHTVQYLERFDRSGRRLGFQPKLGAEVIPTCFGSIKGARAAARRKWGRVY